MSYSCAGWHCRQCLYDLCENCALKFSKAPQFLTCKNNHELYWSPETDGIYKENNPDSIGFACNTCERKALKEPNWHCDHCSYNVCVECGTANGFKPPLKMVTCDNGHILKQARLEENSDCELKCNACENEIKDKIYFHCEECETPDHVEDIDICCPCALRDNDNMRPHPGYLCREGKKLILLNDIQAIKNLTDEECKCSSCGKNDMERAFICLDCYECYCLKCSKKLYQGISTAHRKKCPKNHPLKWCYVSKYETHAFKCSVCNSRYISGVFSCLECSYDVCIKDIGAHN